MAESPSVWQLRIADSVHSVVLELPYCLGGAQARIARASGHRMSLRDKGPATSVSIRLAEDLVAEPSPSGSITYTPLACVSPGQSNSSQALQEAAAQIALSTESSIGVHVASKALAGEPVQGGHVVLLRDAGRHRAAIGVESRVRNRTGEIAHPWHHLPRWAWTLLAAACIVDFCSPLVESVEWAG